jgi:competence protein ComEC
VTIGMLFSCAPHWEGVDDHSFTFGVIDVGEGLSQMAQVGERAVAFDIGPAEAFAKWKTDYVRQGSPYLNAIVLSHDHADHDGGLHNFDATLRWSGFLYVNPYEDTAMVRSSIAEPWKSRVVFKTVHAGDDLSLLDGVSIRCLWPPAGLPDSVTGDADAPNRYSTVFLLKKGTTSVLITSDIDSTAERALDYRENDGLKADLLVVPHHGSCGSVEPVFYGYVHPSFAVISCAADNSYGFPCGAVLQWISQMGISASITAVDGTAFFTSNGYYWQGPLRY